MDTLLKIVKQLPLLRHLPDLVLMLKHSADTLCNVLGTGILIDILFIYSLHG